MKKKTFQYLIYLQGEGKDKDEAWLNAIEAFSENPGLYDETHVEEIRDFNE